MEEFDPRRRGYRLAPPAAAFLGGAGALMLAWNLFVQPDDVEPKAAPLAPEQVAALQHQAFAAAETQPGLARAQQIAVKIQPGETFEAAVARAGVAPAEARQVVGALRGAMDVVNIKAGLKFEAAVAKPAGDPGPVRLIGLSLRTGPATAVTLSRSCDGALRLRELDEEVRVEMTVADGEVHGSLYQSAAELGASPT
ncbi:MAG: M23 family peptidase, partial [Phenylobacterium sp.]